MMLVIHNKCWPDSEKDTDGGKCYMSNMTEAVRVREKYKAGRGNPFFTISKSPTGVKQISDCLKMSTVRGANGCNRKKEISLSACTAGHAGAVHTKHA